MPAEGIYVEHRACIDAQGFGGAERGDGGGDVVVPGTGEGVVFLIRKGEVGAQFQIGFGAEQRDAVDLAAGRRDMLFKPPAQAAEEIKLAFARVVVIGRVGAAQRVIARAVEMGVFQRNRIGKAGQIVGIKVDDIAEHGVAAFIAVEGQHFADVARLAEWVEQVFGVVAVVDPGAGGGLDQAVDGADHGAVGMGVKGDAVNARAKRGRYGDAVMGQHHDMGKPGVQIVLQGGVNLNRVLGHHQGDRAHGKVEGGGREEVVERGVIHRVPANGSCCQMRISNSPVQGHPALQSGRFCHRGTP